MKNTQDIVEKHFDAIVVGTGITGGWAAKELCEGGLKTPGSRERQDGKASRRLPYNEYGPLGPA